MDESLPMSAVFSSFVSGMTNVVVASTSSRTEIDHLFTLCKYISQTASRIRFSHLFNDFDSPIDIKFYRDQLLSIAENVEGSAVLLESLLAIEQRKSYDIESKKPRYHYTQDELLKLRGRVTPNLSNQIQHSLNLVIEHVNTKSNKMPCRNIRYIVV